MKYTIIISLILSFLYNSKMSGQENHLEPLEDIFSVYNYKFEYYSIVREKLYKNLSDSPEIRFLTMPSFSGENVLQIDFDKKTQKYYIQYNAAKKNIWYSEEKRKVEIMTFKKEIDKKSVELVTNLFKKVILGVRYREKEGFARDGTNYYFMVWDFGIKGGKIWSPDKDSNMGELVEIGNQLIEFCKTEELDLNNDIIHRITQLNQKL